MTTVSPREQINSAIGTWSGFIYQGLCGILTALKMIEADRAGVAGYKLQLDGYEDFSILDGTDQIVSLHQCKCIKGRTEYAEDLNKMKIKRDSLTNKRPDIKSYFHCNETVTMVEGLEIEPYPFKDGKTKCGPGELKSIIKEVLTRLKKRETDEDIAVSKLEALVNSNVLNTQQLYFDSNKRLYTIARKQFIEFSEIEAICNSVLIRLDVGDMLAMIKARYIEQFNERVGVNGGFDKLPWVEMFIIHFTNLDEEGMKLFMQRIHPKEKFEYSLKSLLNVCSPERINLLFNLVDEFRLDSEKLHWVTPNTKQTPSTLSDDQEIALTCRQIFDNRANFDAMWIYDWFVGKIDGRVNGSSIPDIRKVASTITDVEEATETGNSIFHEKKVGIMTLTDKRNGKFD